nr:hypothetical protein [uncultured Mediterranean phage uvMED]|tara:strand:+ start:202 stop:375 length:174 start_codon:yes stop_codon:yes gene_type:complete
MTNKNVKSSWRVQSIEYSGVGDKPQFILLNDIGDFKFVPVEIGITNLRQLLASEEEE